MLNSRPSYQCRSHHMAVGDHEMTSFSPLNVYMFTVGRIICRARAHVIKGCLPK
jgi:hypothetical protein